ncbi:MAG: TPM domain-containing protein [Flavobacteriales bacterium]|nr:TPM domain-containing protein [Flavobacteriales bacterium]HPF68148.1 TPM domain-containing protein [Flavobacteriales bacterium]HPQ57322.1 TPM domain-containing protein [Flavobacteriales bacterium]HRW89777.1 TPM domain-containing protein [Flavobacteriales bacterium]
MSSVLTADQFLDTSGRAQVREAIGAAERRTSGELRVHLEDHIEEDVLDHAAYVFEELGMHRTRDRNGVLVYVAVADRQVAVLGDSGINEQVPDGFWTDVVGLLKLHFAAGRHAEGLVEAVHLIGEKLSSFFPLREDDTDELSNEVSIGRR